MSEVRIPVVLRKIRSLIFHIRNAVMRRVYAVRVRRAEALLREKGIIDLLLDGREGEFSPQFYDLYNLYVTVRRRRPQRVIEFRIGFSTLVLLRALHDNYVEDKKENFEQAEKRRGRLWSVEDSEEWIENTRNKIPDYLQVYSTICHSEISIQVIDGELCHTYDKLPNITPELIYLDGAVNVKGTVNGLSFDEGGKTRGVVAADILLYESTLRPGAYVIVDKRYNNVFFLKRRLKRKYIVHGFDYVTHLTSFELFE